MARAPRWLATTAGLVLAGAALAAAASWEQLFEPFLGFHAVAIDTRGAQEVVGFDGRALRESDHARAAGIRGTPTFVFHGPDGRALATHVGGIYDPQEFIVLGEYVAAGAYRTGSFADFKQSRRRQGS